MLWIQYCISSGAVAACNFNNEIAFGGNYIVQKDFRRINIGKQLFNHIKEHVGSRNVGINGVENMVEHYQSVGFVNKAFPILTYTGKPNQRTFSIIADRNNQPLIKYTCNLFEELFHYDTEIHTTPRREFLKCWLNENITTTYCVVNSGKIIGYGCVQPTDRGVYAIGPVYADTPDIAHSLFTKFMLSVPDGSGVAMNILPDNKLLMDIVHKHSLTLQLKMYRMYRTKTPQLDLDRVYAFSTVGISLV